MHKPPSISGSILLLLVLVQSISALILSRRAETYHDAQVAALRRAGDQAVLRDLYRDRAAACAQKLDACTASLSLTFEAGREARADKESCEARLARLDAKRIRTVSEWLPGSVSDDEKQTALIWLLQEMKRPVACRRYLENWWQPSRPSGDVIGCRKD